MAVAAFVEAVEKGGEETGTANGINGTDVVVGNLRRGEYKAPPSDTLSIGPFMWDGKVKMLARAATDADWVITQAIDINDAGDILAKGDNDALGRMNHLLLLRAPTVTR